MSGNQPDALHYLRKASEYAELVKSQLRLARGAAFAESKGEAQTWASTALRQMDEPAMTLRKALEELFQPEVPRADR